MPGPVHDDAHAAQAPPTPIPKLLPSRDIQYVITNRNGIVEDRHEIHVAITDATGKLIRSIGDYDRLTLIRSAAKPMQALAIVESGAMDKYGLDEADLALSCASHNSEARHVDRARAILEKAGNQESDLACGGHPSILPQINKAWAQDGITPTAVFSNCSGKHSGMLAATRAIGESTDQYHEFQHPIQKRIQEIMAYAAGLDEDQVKWGVDGCNMATPAMPLSCLAKSFAMFADAADIVDRNDAPFGQRTKDMARIFNAMTSYPELVAGEERFCSIFMRACKGQAIGKIGAAACYGIGMRGSEATKALGATGAIGIAVKVESGDLDALYCALPEILQQLSLVSKEVLETLEPFHVKTISNTAGQKTGKYTPYITI
ncbi:hypothetical protein VHEMI06637 [[Torrubiella] hemipterigena]|uniref:L-asparaginase II n=1 Tax=[Torrubiella] hemipterigena TaxID=1531966 RepID=A0A0A1T7V3_9HYPO|nr:hypothetical protein VHEMI06637 [[Torrubiella] hemipterigena]